MLSQPRDADLPELLRESRLTDVLVALGTVVAVGVVAWLAAHAVARLLTGKTRFGLRGLERLAAPLVALMSAVVALVIANRAESAPETIGEVLELFVTVAAFWLGARVIDVIWATARQSARLRTRPRVRNALVVARHLGKLTLLLAAIAVLAVQLGANEQLYVVIAAAAAGIAFAARDPIRNAIAFASMAIDPPFHIGDSVRISDFRTGQASVGTIVDISLTSVTLTTREQTNIVIANVMLGQLRIENLSVADRRRIELDVPVGRVPTEKLRDACVALDHDLREHPGVSGEHDPRVWLTGTGDGIHLKLSLWLRRVADRREVQREVLLKVHEHLR